MSADSYQTVGDTDDDIDLSGEIKTKTNSFRNKLLLVVISVIFIGVIVAVIYISVGSGSSAVLESVPLSKFEVSNPDAVCNDGSPGIYYVRRNELSDKWIIYIQGGTLYCWDDIGCDVRWTDNPELMSSNYAEEEREGEGIMSDDCELNPEFCDFNIGFAFYCSSDYWSGNNAAENTQAGQHFKGYTILTEIIDHLINDHGVKNASEILLAGKGGGGVAMAFAGSRVVTQLQEGLVTDAPIKGVMDTGWLYDQEPFDESFYPCTNYTSYDQCNFRAAITYGVGADAWAPEFSEYCSSRDYTWECYFGLFVFEDVEEALEGDVYVFSYQYDYAQAGCDGVNLWTDPIGDDENEYATSAAEYFIEQEIQPNVAAGMFPDCWSHEIIDSTALHDISVDDVDFYTHFVDWYNGASSLLHDGPEYEIGTNPSC